MPVINIMFICSDACVVGVGTMIKSGVMSLKRESYATSVRVHKCVRKQLNINSHHFYIVIMPLSASINILNIEKSYRKYFVSQWIPIKSNILGIRINQNILMRTTLLKSAINVIHSQNLQNLI